VRFRARLALLSIVLVIVLTIGMFLNARAYHEQAYYHCLVYRGIWIESPFFYWCMGKYRLHRAKLPRCQYD
jgi:hypothetical protein